MRNPSQTILCRDVIHTVNCSDLATLLAQVQNTTVDSKTKGWIALDP